METHDIVIKSVPQIRVVAARKASDQPFEPLFKEVYEYLSTFAADHNLQADGPMMAVFYEDPADPDCGCDFAVAFPTDDQIETGQSSE